MAKKKDELVISKPHIIALSFLLLVYIYTTLLVYTPTPKSVLGITKDSDTRYVSTLSDLPLAKDLETTPVISADSAVVIDLDSKVTLYKKDSEKQVLPASTTKIVTALTALENYSLDEVLVVPALRYSGSRMGLVANEKITVENLLKGLLVSSANDAAEVLAHNHPKGRSGFIKQMNDISKGLNLTKTNFTNPSGFDDYQHYSSAVDLTRAAEELLKREEIAKILTIQNETVASTDGEYQHRLNTTNELLGAIDGVKGVKTGWTLAAKENLVTYYEKDGRRIVFVVLGSQDRFDDTKKLIEWILENYDWVDVSEESSVIP